MAGGTPLTRFEECQWRTCISYLHWIVPDDLLPPRHMTEQILRIDSLALPPA